MDSTARAEVTFSSKTEVAKTAHNPHEIVFANRPLVRRHGADPVLLLLQFSDLELVGSVPTAERQSKRRSPEYDSTGGPSVERCQC